MSDSAANPYLRDAVLTATSEQLQLMLYDGCIRYARQARDAIERKDYETSFDRLSRAQKIIMELQNGLNYEVNRELCERVASIYGFLYRKLVDANINRDVGCIDDALRILKIERETWGLLVDKLNRVQDGQDGEELPITPATNPAIHQEIVEPEPVKVVDPASLAASREPGRPAVTFCVDG